MKNLIGIKNKYLFNLMIIISLFSILLYVLNVKLLFDRNNIIYFQNVFILILIFFTIYFINKYCYDNNKIYHIIITSVFFITTIIRLSFMLYNNPEIMHDAYYPDPSGQGHLGYIMYLYVNHSLPDSLSGLYYHPPLYYLICSFFANILELFNISDYKNIAYFSKCISFIIINFTYYILYQLTNYLKLNIKNKTLFLCFCFCHPIFIIFSGFSNNDVLSTFFYIFSIYLLLLWNKDTNLKNTIYLTVSVALGNITKSNCLTFYFLFFIVFIFKYFSIKKNYKTDLFKKFFIILLFSVIPLLIWKIRNYIIFNKTSEYNLLGFMDLDRIMLYLFGLDFNQFRFIYYGELGTVSGSILPYLFKTEVFMEFTYYNIFIAPNILFFSNLVITFLSIISIVFVFVYNIKHKKENYNDLFFFFIYILMFCSILYFSLLDSRTCTPAFRYIVPIILPKIYFILRGKDILLLKIKHKSIKLYIEYFFILFIVLFCLSSIFIYLKIDLIEDLCLYRIIF